MRLSSFGDCLVRKIYTVLAACALMESAGPQTPPPGWPAVVEGYRAAVQKAGIVGSSLMVVRDGQVVAHQNEGMQHLARREPVTEDTIYHWASITKTFTGLATLEFREPRRVVLAEPAG